MSESPRTYPQRVVSHWPEIAVAAALLVALGISAALGATGPAALLLIAALPVLFFAFLSEVDRWSDQGAIPLAASVVVSVAVGVLWAVVVNSRPINDAQAAAAVVAIPTLLAFTGCWLIHLMHHYDEVLDGFAFSAAIVGGWYLGFLAIVVVPEALSASSDEGLTWQFLLAIAPTALLLPVAVSASAGVLVASAWVSRDPGPQYVQRRWLSSAIVILLGSLVGGVFMPGFSTSVFWLGALAVGAVLVARQSLRPLLVTAGEADDG
jgi:hypothetical protein